jgi:hypothetical protein
VHAHLTTGSRRAAVGWLAVAGALVVGLASSPVSAQRATGQPATDQRVSVRRAPVPIAGCPVFPADNYWNADVSRLPVALHSAAWMAHMSSDRNLHPDFGPSGGAQSTPYGIPITTVDASHATVPVTFEYASESDQVRYPLGPDTMIEGGATAGGDRHALVVDRSSCRLYETWATRTSGGRWYAGSGATWSLRSDALRPDGWTSADAAGLPILAGLLRYPEVEVNGRVSHAIRFTTDVTQRLHVWPARHDAGSTSSPDYPPMGARFRLKAGFPLTGYRPDTVVVLRAMKTYGLVLADNGSPWFFQGSADQRWPSGLLDQLKTIPASAFEAVDTRPLMVSPNSGATK